jgi:hypothetical protein
MLDLSEDIRTFVEGGIRPLSADEIFARAHHSDENRWRPTRRVLVPVLVAGIAVAALVVLLVYPQWGPGGGPQPAAAAELLLFASRADDIPSLGPGQFLYSEMQTQGIVAGSRLESGVSVNEYLSVTDQTWINAHGYGRFVVTQHPTPQFYSQSDRIKWIKAGSPPMQGVAPGEIGVRTGEIVPTLDLAPTPNFNVTDLPTTTAALKRALTSDLFNTEIPTEVLQCHSSECLVVVKAAAILQGPAVGATPALRRALFQLLAHVPGVVNDGKVRDHVGATGIELSYVDRIPAHTQQFGCEHGVGLVTDHVAASSNRFSFVVDPNTTQVLQTEQNPNPRYQPMLVNPCFPESSPRTYQFDPPQWVSVQSEAVVASDTSTTSTHAS